MITEKDTIKCEAIFNEERSHRLLWKRVWNKDKPLATVIMLNPALADTVLTDTTTYLVVNNIARMETYGGVNIVNLFSLLTPKLQFKGNQDEEINIPENDDYIKKAADESDAIILAWGKAADSNQHISDRATEVINMLMKHKEKLYVITDGERRSLHPLTPQIRNYWELEKVSLHAQDA